MSTLINRMRERLLPCFRQPEATTGDVVLAPSDKRWRKDFTDEAARLSDLPSQLRALIDHVGSTAVKGIAAKPFIDILVTLPDWDQVPMACMIIAGQGYQLREQINGAEPRFFFMREGIDGRSDTTLHLTPADSRYALDMIDFRDALRLDHARSRQYVDLKRSLADAFPNDLQSYTAGKAPFVAETLARWKGAYSVNRLLTHQTIELSRAGRLQVYVIVAQFLLAFVAALSVLTNNATMLAEYAVAGAALVVGWVLLSQRQRKHRGAGDQARRAVLVRSGLGELMSRPQIRTIVEQFSLSIKGRPEARIEEYFSSRKAAGNQRLIDMLSESAYWTRDLQSGGAWLFGGFFLAGLIVFIGILWWSTVVMDRTDLLTILRILISFLIFLLSSDIVGTFLGHLSASRSLGVLLHRIELAEAVGTPTPDLLLLMADYNAAAEASPLLLPAVYWWKRRNLSESWHAYAASHKIGEAARSLGDQSGDMQGI